MYEYLTYVYILRGIFQCCMCIFTTAIREIIMASVHARWCRRQWCCRCCRKWRRVGGEAGRCSYESLMVMVVMMVMMMQMLWNLRLLLLQMILRCKLLRLLCWRLQDMLVTTAVRMMNFAATLVQNRIIRGGIQILQVTLWMIQRKFRIHSSRFSLHYFTNALLSNRERLSHKITERKYGLSGDFNITLQCYTVFLKNVCNSSTINVRWRPKQNVGKSGVFSH